MRILSPALPALTIFAAVAACGIALTHAPAAGAAVMDSGDWHSYHKVGSIGIVDEADRDEVEFIGGRVRIRPGLDTATVMTFDSNDYDQEQGYRIDNVNISDPSWQFLNGNAYWFEVTLQRTGPGGKPELGMIR